MRLDYQSLRAVTKSVIVDLLVAVYLPKRLGRVEKAYRTLASMTIKERMPSAKERNKLYEVTKTQ